MIGIAECHKVTSVIAVSGTTSTAVDLEGATQIGLIVPVLNDTPDLTLQVSDESDGTFVDLKNIDGSTAVTIVGGATALGVSSSGLAALAGYRFVRIVASVAQTSARTFTWILKQ